MGIVILIALLGAGYVGFTLFSHSGDSNETVDVLIPRKSSISQVADILESQKVISNKKVFKYLLAFSGGNKKVRAGEFRFHTGLSPIQALKVLYYDESILHPITVPEGWTVRQIAEILAGEKLVNQKRFVDLALNPHAPQKYGFKSPSLEGYLFPDTYSFSVIDGEEKIIDIMVQRLISKISPLKSVMLAKGWTTEQVLTLASIVEKETGNPAERPIISSVFQNRLKKKMRLQSDPTTIYGISDFNGNLTKKDLQTPTPYNTYTISGLPPGPIASAGEDAIKSILYPAETEFFYFVSNNNGSHIFSKTYSEHSRHVSTTQPLIERRHDKNQSKIKTRF